MDKSKIVNSKSEILHLTSQLPLMEHFYTIQGEGFHQGRAAYFIRLGGCDVGCVWCDVKDSWDASKHPLFSVDEIVKFVTDAKANLTVITGGEPLMYDLSELTKSLHQKNIEVNIETSGAYSLSGEIDWICVSPKKFKKPLDEVLSKANELKMVVFNKSDFDWAEANAKKVANSCQLFLQPEWDKASEILPYIIAFVKENPRWKISLQTHKFINIP